MMDLALVRAMTDVPCAGVTSETAWMLHAVGPQKHASVEKHRSAQLFVGWLSDRGCNKRVHLGALEASEVVSGLITPVA